MVKLVEFFDFSEKDLIMFLFFGSLFITMVIYWMLSDLVKKMRGENMRVNIEFILKILLLPILIASLTLKGVKKGNRKKAVNLFLYT